MTILIQADVRLYFKQLLLENSDYLALCFIKNFTISLWPWSLAFDNAVKPSSSFSPVKNL